MRVTTVCLLCCLLLGTTGCASIIGKSQYPVRVTSQPDQADITITDETGATVFTGKTPTTVTLKTKAGYFRGKDYTVTFTKNGYAKHTAEIRRGTSKWYIFGSLVFGGLVGWLIVDPATGAMWTLQEDVNANLASLRGAAGGDSALRITLIGDVPPALQAKMKKIE
ncbi:MAG: hypothetical protein ACJ76Y_10495 [Thermoanaerobaculia bacterium]